MSARRSLTRGIGELLRLLDPGLSDLVRTPQEDGYGNKVLGADGMPVKTRQYEFLNTKGESVFIQEHSLGHSKATPQHGLEPHFNVRPADPVTGLAIDNKTPSNVHGHYNFLKK